MLFAVRKEDIQSALSRVGRVVKSNSKSAAILQCVLFSSYAGKVYITATSHISSVKVVLPTLKNINIEGSFAVNFDKLKDRISKSSSEILLETDLKVLKVQSSNDQKLGIALNNATAFPEVKWVDPDESYGVPKDSFLDTLTEFNRFTANVSSLTPAFLQVLIRDQLIFSSSGSSYIRKPLEVNPNLDVRIPTNSLSHLASFIQETEEDTVWISQDPSNAVVVTVGTEQIQASSSTVPFPNLAPLFDNAEVACVEGIQINRTDLLKELIRAKTSLDRWQQIKLNVSGVGYTSMKVSTVSDVGDWFESSIPCTWVGGKDIEMIFSFDTLSRFLTMFKEEKVNLMIGPDIKGDPTQVLVEEGESSGVITQFRI